MAEHLLEVENLKMYFKKVNGVFRRKTSYVKAVDNISFTIDKKETFGLVGESGCGKTTTGRALIRLYEPTGGTIRYDGEDITKLSAKEFMPYRKKMQMIFQDPYASLNARMTVSDIIGEPLDIHHLKTGKEREEFILELLDRVGLNKDHASRYPHEFSGGQRQRVGIARALAVDPEFIICDEPISALDVSIQAQVVNMLKDLQEEFGLTYLFVAHDLSMVRHISDRVGVMYLGSLVEVAETEELYRNNLHPLPFLSLTRRRRRRISRSFWKVRCRVLLTPLWAASLPAAAPMQSRNAGKRRRRCEMWAEITMWRAIWCKESMRC